MDHGLELTSRAESTHFWFRGFRRFVAPVLADVARGRRDLRLLDCGCGTGFNLSLLRPYGKAWGFDLSAVGVARARTAGAAAVRGDITRIPFASSTFDVATSFDVLQCVPEDAAAVAEMARVLRPGGAVVLTLAAFEALRGDHAIAWNEVRRYTPQSARRLVEGAGLRVERVSFHFASVLPVIAAARFAQRILRPLRGVRGDADIAVPAAPVNQVLTALVTAEAAIARRWPMPIGSSILVVGRKC
jgi:SAM-dependent methyltransferase